MQLWFLWHYLMFRSGLLDNEKSSAELKVEKPLGTSPYPKRIKRPRSFYSPERFGYRPSKEKVANRVMLEKVDALTKFELILQLEMRLQETLSRCKGQAGDAHETSPGEKLKQAGGRKSRGGSDTHSHAWAFCEAICIDSSNAGTKNGETSIVEALREREQGANSGMVAYRPNGVGVHGKRWVSALNGWDSLEKQRLGPSYWLQKRAYSSWMPICTVSRKYLM